MLKNSLSPSDDDKVPLLFLVCQAVFAKGCHFSCRSEKRFKPDVDAFEVGTKEEDQKGNIPLR